MQHCLILDSDYSYASRWNLLHSRHTIATLKPRKPMSSTCYTAIVVGYEHIQLCAIFHHSSELDGHLCTCSCSLASQGALQYLSASFASLVMIDVKSIIGLSDKLLFVQYLTGCTRRFCEHLMTRTMHYLLLRNYIIGKYIVRSLKWCRRHLTFVALSLERCACIPMSIQVLSFYWCHTIATLNSGKWVWPI
jgi:hypothetical protein